MFVNPVEDHKFVNMRGRNINVGNAMRKNPSRIYILFHNERYVMNHLAEEIPT